jgi:hypothetical protein
MIIVSYLTWWLKILKNGFIGMNEFFFDIDFIDNEIDRINKTASIDFLIENIEYV